MFEFLFFHTFAELFSILIGFTAFIFTWNTRHIIKNNYFLVISIFLLCVGIIDLFHTFAYRGIGIFPDLPANIPTQLWITGRYLVALAFIIAPRYINRALNPYHGVSLGVSITSLLIFLIFTTHILPLTYIEGQGLTPFKIYSEYIIIMLFLSGIVYLFRYRQSFDPRIFNLMIASLGFNAASEFFFTQYVSVYQSTNAFGHVLKIMANYLFYVAVIQIGLKDPYSWLFREIQALNRKKDEFMSIASHDIKSPLTSIKMYSQLLAKNSKQAKAYTAKIIHQVSKIESLVNDLFDIGQIDAGGLKLNPVRFRLDKLIRQCVNDYQDTSLHFLKLIASEAITVKADKDRIRQVVDNLITNAIKYSPSDSTILMGLNRIDSEVKFSIKDQGIGISKANVKKLFSRYYRVEGGTQVSGSGYGLFIAKQIITQHFGKIWVESQKGKGSTFYFTLPLQSRA